MKKQLDTPVLLLAFNRPDLIKKVFEQIRKVKPKELYLSSDGPRNTDEGKKVTEVRKIISNVDWPCKVYKRFPKKNLGIIGGALGAINWFFDNVEEGIILEDDSVPSLSFFKFCSVLLKKYRDNDKIMQVNGTNFQRGWKNNNDSYYFSKYPHTYGWATWRRARKNYDSEMKNYLTSGKKYIRKISSNKLERWYLKHIMDDAYEKIPEAIDTRWVYSVMMHGGLCITPNENLVQCIGFREDAAHTKKEDSFLSIPTKNVSFPLKHPVLIKLNKKSDERYVNWLFFNILKKKVLYKINHFFRT